MGYYSDVALVIKNDVVIPEEISSSGYWRVHAEITVGKNYTLVHWHSTKWYEGGYNPVIDSIIKMMKCLDSKAYQFFRIGEDIYDYEMDGEAAWTDADCEFEVFPIWKFQISMPGQSRSKYHAKHRA
jgi:hypothetical protein